MSVAVLRVLDVLINIYNIYREGMIIKVIIPILHVKKPRPSEMAEPGFVLRQAGSRTHNPNHFTSLPCKL